MKSKQDGTAIPAYAAETEHEIVKSGPGGHGNFNSMEDSVGRGITPELVAATAARSGEAGSETTTPDFELEQRIREKAYELWTLEGQHHGRDLQHWHMATEIVAQEAVSKAAKKGDNAA